MGVIFFQHIEYIFSLFFCFHFSCCEVTSQSACYLFEGNLSFLLHLLMKMFVFGFLWNHYGMSRRFFLNSYLRLYGFFEFLDWCSSTVLKPFEPLSLQT